MALTDSPDSPSGGSGILEPEGVISYWPRTPNPVLTPQTPTGEPVLLAPGELPAFKYCTVANGTPVRKLNDYSGHQISRGHRSLAEVTSSFPRFYEQQGSSSRTPSPPPTFRDEMYSDIRSTSQRPEPHRARSRASRSRSSSTASEHRDESDGSPRQESRNLIPEIVHYSHSSALSKHPTSNARGFSLSSATWEHAPSSSHSRAASPAHVDSTHNGAHNASPAYEENRRSPYSRSYSPPPSSTMANRPRMIALPGGATVQPPSSPSSSSSRKRSAEAFESDEDIRRLRKYHPSLPMSLSVSSKPLSNGSRPHDSPTSRVARPAERDEIMEDGTRREPYMPPSDQPNNLKTTNPTAVKRYPCTEPWCKETFTRRNDVTRHLKNAAAHRGGPHQVDREDKRCKHCNSDLSRADARARHERAGACGKRTLQRKEYITPAIDFSR